MASQYIVGELYKQLTKVINKPISIAEVNGNPITVFHDLNRIKHFYLSESISRDKSSYAIEGHPELRAIPAYLDGKLHCLIITELQIEDIQMIQIITSLTELIMTQFIEANKPKPDVVDLLMTRLLYRPHTIDREELEQTISSLGFRSDVQRVAVLLELRGFWSNYLQTISQPHTEKKSLISAKKHDIEQSLTSFFTKNQDNIIGYVGDDKFLVLKDLGESDFENFYTLFKKNFKQITDSLKNIHIQDFMIGIGQPTRTINGLLTSVEEAKQALEIGSRINSGSHIFRLDELGVLPLLVSSTVKQKQDFTNYLIGDVALDTELIETLETFLHENLNLTQAAEKLNVHRNTVIYRLDKITEKVGKDPRQFTCAVELYLALTFKKVFPK